MGVIKSIAPDLILMALVAFIGYFIAPQIGIEDNNLIVLISIGLILIILIIHHLIGPSIEIEFNERKNSLILIRNSIHHRAKDLKFNVELFPKFYYLSKLFSISQSDLKDLCFQIHWQPKKSLHVKKNMNYDSLQIKDGYPIICASNLVVNQNYDYSLKISCTQYNEAKNIEINIKKILNSKKFKLRLYSYLIRMKAGTKSVKIDE